MTPKKENPTISKVEESSVVYESSKLKFKGIDWETFDFDEEFKKGLTLDEAKAKSIKKIRAWWGK